MCKVSAKKSRILTIAINSAAHSEMKSKHGCVLVLNGKPVVTGTNHLRGYMRGQTILSCHAEIDAIHKASKVVLR